MNLLQKKHESIFDPYHYRRKYSAPIKIEGNPTPGFREIIHAVIDVLPKSYQDALRVLPLAVTQDRYIVIAGEKVYAHGLFDHTMGRIRLSEWVFMRKPWHNDSLEQDIARTIMHEVGHAMGLNEEQLSQAGL